VARIPSDEREGPTRDAIREEIESHLAALLYDAPEEIPEALEVAVHDPVAALECFRAMVPNLGAKRAPKSATPAASNERAEGSGIGITSPSRTAQAYPSL
jgi:hypothetical protein